MTLTCHLKNCKHIFLEMETLLMIKKKKSSYKKLEDKILFRIITYVSYVSGARRIFFERRGHRIIEKLNLFVGKG